MSFEPHYVNSWIMYMAFLYMFAVTGVFLWGLFNCNIDNFPEMEPFVRKVKKRKKIKKYRPIIKKVD